MDSTYAVYLQAYVGGLAGYKFFMRDFRFSQKLQCNLLQGALYSFGANSCGTRTRGWHSNDHANCCLQIPLHALQGVASFISWLYRPRRAFSWDNLCAICWPCYLTLANGCYCCILWINISKCPSRRLCRSSCISGFVPFLLQLLTSMISKLPLVFYTFLELLKFYQCLLLQECSLWSGLCYIVASLSLYDEYSNDVLDMPEGSCFPRFW